MSTMPTDVAPLRRPRSARGETGCRRHPPQARHAKSTRPRHVVLARYYDPVIGRFTATDPLASLADPGSLDAYGYGRGSPVTLSDPTGLFGLPSLEAMYQSYYHNAYTAACLSQCGGQQLVNAVANDPSGLGGAVFDAIDVANQGDIGKADGNWSQRDIDAAMDGRQLAGIAQAMGLDGDNADRFVRLVRDVATRLNGEEDLWESIDDEKSWWDRNGGTVKTIGKAAIFTTALVAGTACIAATAGVCGGAVGTMLVTGTIGAVESVSSYAIDQGGNMTLGGVAFEATSGFALGGSSALGSSFAIPLRTGGHSAGVKMSQFFSSRFHDSSGARHFVG